jgi:carboxyl-terminal processing protease
MNFFSKSVIISFAMLLTIASVANAELTTTSEVATEDNSRLPLQELRRFTDAFSHIRKHYVEEVSDQELFDLAIHGMLTGLDPHSNYLEPKEFEELQEDTSGEFGGLGIEIDQDDGFIRVVTPIDDSPAKAAGIQAGDLIIKLDGDSVRGMSIEESIEVMRGAPGTKLELEVISEGSNRPTKITVLRDIIKVPSVRSRELEPGFAYIRIAQFQAKTGDETKDAIQNFLDSDNALKGIVLDLRNNPGGVLSAAAEVAEAVQDGGLVVYTEGRSSADRTDLFAADGDMTKGVPVVVLINGGSASASEIVAGSLQDHKRAIIMGSDSFGKGSVQAVIQVSEDHAIKLTTALYFTPEGRSIQALGIKPDIEVARAKVEVIKGRNLTEADLSGHLKNANGKQQSKGEERRKDQAESLLQRDNQLYEALSLLKGLHIIDQGKKQLAQTKIDRAVAELDFTEPTGEPRLPAQP